MRSGIVQGYPSEDGAVFKPDQPITGAEAAAMLQNALDLPAAVFSDNAAEPAWQMVALTTVADHGITLSDSETVTRGQTAIALYQAANLQQPVEDIRQ